MIQTTHMPRVAIPLSEHVTHSSSTVNVICEIPPGRPAPPEPTQNWTRIVQSSRAENAETNGSPAEQGSDPWKNQREINIPWLKKQLKCVKYPGAKAPKTGTEMSCLDRFGKVEWTVDTHNPIWCHTHKTYLNLGPRSPHLLSFFPFKQFQTSTSPSPLPSQLPISLAQLRQAMQRRAHLHGAQLCLRGAQQPQQPQQRGRTALGANPQKAESQAATSRQLLDVF